jgi:hypothetical protein
MASGPVGPLPDYLLFVRVKEFDMRGEPVGVEKLFSNSDSLDGRGLTHRWTVAAFKRLVAAHLGTSYPQLNSRMDIIFKNPHGEDNKVVLLNNRKLLYTTGFRNSQILEGVPGDSFYCENLVEVRPRGGAPQAAGRDEALACAAATLNMQD